MFCYSNEQFVCNCSKVFPYDAKETVKYMAWPRVVCFEKLHINDFCFYRTKPIKLYVLCAHSQIAIFKTHQTKGRQFAYTLFLVQLPEQNSTKSTTGHISFFIFCMWIMEKHIETQLPFHLFIMNCDIEKRRDCICTDPTTHVFKIILPL